MEGLVSVVMPTYNRSFSFIWRSINSVLSQSYTNLELIIVDDNQKGNVNKKDIETNIKGLDDERIKYIPHRDNKGACAARNTGVKNSVGNYIAFLDDDDEWLPSKVEKQLEKFKNPLVGLVYCPYFINRNNEKILRKSIKRGSLFEDLLYGNFIGSTSCVMVRKDSILEVGLFDENLPASQDYELYLRISDLYLIDVVDEPLVIYYNHQGERISGDPLKKLEARKYIYHKYKKHIEKFPKVNSEKHLLLAHSYSQIKNNRLKWKHWFRALFIHPIPTKRFLKLTYRIWFDL